MNEYEQEHLRRLRSGLPECMVLLKSNGDFPLAKAEQIALYGSGARNTVKGGTGSGEVNSRFFVSVEQGLTDAGFAVTTKAWLDAYDRVLAEAKAAFINEIKARARRKHTMAVIEGMGSVMPEPEYDIPLDGEGTTAVYVLSRISGEGNDRSSEAGDFMLSNTERRDILALRARYEKFLLALNVGGPVDLSAVGDVENILVLSQLGVETGAALADVLLGRANPSGKLTTTWAKWEDYQTVGTFGEHDDTRYNEGVYVGYRYFDSLDQKPLFPFGFGLSYTTFKIESGNVSREGTRVTVRAKVTNTGKTAGKEVVQLYVSVPEGKLDQPYHALAGWVKTSELAPGCSEPADVAFDLRALASYDADKAQYLLEQGDYTLRIGNSSRNTVICGVVTLDKTAVVRQVRNCGGEPDFIDWKPAQKRNAGSPGDVPHLIVPAEEITAETVAYDREYEIDPLIAGLTDEQLAYMNVGAFDPKGGIMSVIGNASKSVAGAAGESTGMLLPLGIPAVVMADGPAGLRLSKQYVKDADGVRAIGETMPESLTVYMSKAQLWLMRRLAGKPKDSLPVHEQYMTALPIGTAVAQSWNLDFAQTCGDIVGDEMERTGVHLWLAPALNIHRSVRCGRNFEYYSEDPFISGMFAASVTRGVQSHRGCGVTIKHYTANNQETNRYSNSSAVSERALREIYLKGFQICVQSARPHAVMTSYNLLNGVHTSERRDLIEDVLRSESGFDGIVMTDWLVMGGTMSGKSKYPAPRAARIAAAGGELVMPGSKQDWRSILAALKTGELPRRQLQINATRLYRQIKRLTDERASDE